MTAPLLDYYFLRKSQGAGLSPLKELAEGSEILARYFSMHAQAGEPCRLGGDHESVA